ncbi:hypothetical protein JIQ42_05920 [Leishmania sp. Namibia]|uniref:hypothetical protein n=1 Tax=Leishmania sp. Namibia TaxID=2802991 RepID=UPI001B549089|nr:hypothetical protein JIQ42_05920 [Leishmania sp. Namibia]
MRECLHLTRVMCHQRHDKGGNAHNFPFDTLTKVYRDAVYVPQEHYRGNPMHPERGRGASFAPSRCFGITGAMSPVATKLSEWMEQQHEEEDPSDRRGTGHTSATSSLATPIARSQVASSIHSPASSAAASTAEGMPVDDEAVRLRPRAHLFSDRNESERQAVAGQPRSPSSTPAAAVSTSTRRSGVQAEILSVYRNMLREVARMQDTDTRRDLSAYIRQEYDKQRDIPRKNIMKIEWKLNYSKRKLEELQAMSKHTKFTIMR